jgi:hypothetical protein
MRIRMMPLALALLAALTWTADATAQVDVLPILSETEYLTAVIGRIPIERTVAEGATTEVLTTHEAGQDAAPPPTDGTDLLPITFILGLLGVSTLAWSGLFWVTRRRRATAPPSDGARGRKSTSRSRSPRRPPCLDAARLEETLRTRIAA